MLRYDTPLARLRTIGILEGISYLVLLFLAMPLKYLADMPMAVRVVGSLHGLLFVWLFVLTAGPFFRRERSLAWATRIGVASIVPFGMFAIDRRLREEELAERSGRAESTWAPVRERATAARGSGVEPHER